MPSFELGGPIPSDTHHAVSVSLPTWKSNVGYEEGESWVVSKMTAGYPRFFVHKSIEAFAHAIVSKHSHPGQQAVLFPTPKVARRCLDFVKRRAEPSAVPHITVVDFTLDASTELSPLLKKLNPVFSAVLLPVESFPLAKQYWQHTGDGVSSRRAEFCHSLYNQGLLVPAHGTVTPPETPTRPVRGPRRYQRPESVDGISCTSAKTGPTDDQPKESHESLRFLEERFGRNLDLSQVERAESAIKRRIAGTLATDEEAGKKDRPAAASANSNTRDMHSLSEDDVFLFPCGMNAIYNAHRALLATRGDLKSILYGFPYVDTLKILEKFGPGCQFYGLASADELDDLEQRLRNGERFLALFCEFPGNPLLICPDMQRIRVLADQYDFAVVVDETIGTFANINVLQDTDIVVSSLTKIFSGDSNVMGGSAILNPESKYYANLKAAINSEDFEDTYWPEDVIFMERNSRDFIERVERVNANAEALCSVFLSSPLIKRLYYPKHDQSKSIYDVYRLPNAGYGGLLSVVFKDPNQAKVFFDTIETAKGPSLGTNFTLCSPYVILAHYSELDWAEQFGVDRHLVRISVGLEATRELTTTFDKALQAAAAVMP